MSNPYILAILTYGRYFFNVKWHEEKALKYLPFQNYCGA